MTELVSVAKRGTGHGKAHPSEQRGLLEAFTRKVTLSKPHVPRHRPATVRGKF